MRRWQSGQMHLAVNQAPLRLRRFESYPAHKHKKSQQLLGFFVAHLHGRILTCQGVGERLASRGGIYKPRGL